MSFATSVFFVHYAEGGDNMAVPTDLGGHTVFGISERAHPKDDPRYRDFWLDPTWERAERIYYRDYWLPNRLDELPEHYQAIHFDCVVNHGAGMAGKIFQRGLGRLEDDGVVGPKTIARAHADLTRTDEILAERSAVYADIVRRRPDQQANWIGWMRRSMRLARYALGIQYGIPIHPHGELTRYAA